MIDSSQQLNWERVTQIKPFYVPASYCHERDDHIGLQVTACFSSSARKESITHCQHEKLVEPSQLRAPLLSKHEPDSC